MALNSYREYDGTYNHFRAGYCFDETSARKLTRYALAMTALILRKAAAE